MIYVVLKINLLIYSVRRKKINLVNTEEKAYRVNFDDNKSMKNY